LFSDVRRILCGCYLRLDLRTGTLSSRRAFQLHEDIAGGSQRDHVSRLVTTLSRVVERMLTESELVLDLTGGNDTRLTAAAVANIERTGRRTNAIWRVSGEPQHPDVLIAQRVAAKKGWPLYKLTVHPPAEASLEELREAVIASDGDCLVDVAFNRIRQEHDMMETHRPLIGSIGAELLRGFFWRHEFFALGR